jgi:hypothetical protein
MPHSENRHFAVTAYGQCWELLGRARTPEEDRNLLGAALTSRYHWQEAGGDQERAVADWMVSRACAAIGEAELALKFANASLAYENRTFPAWLRASLQEGMARAHSVAGDIAQRDLYVSQALLELDAESDPEDADLIRNQLSDLLT